MSIHAVFLEDSLGFGMVHFLTKHVAEILEQCINCILAVFISFCKQTKVVNKEEGGIFWGSQEKFYGGPTIIDDGFINVCEEYLHAHDEKGREHRVSLPDFS